VRARASSAPGQTWSEAQPPIRRLEAEATPIDTSACPIGGSQSIRSPGSATCAMTQVRELRATPRVGNAWSAANRAAAGALAGVEVIRGFSRTARGWSGTGCSALGCAGTFGIADCGRRMSSPPVTASGSPDRLLCPDPVRYMSGRLEHMVYSSLRGPYPRSEQYNRTQHRSDEGDRTSSENLALGQPPW